MISSEVTFQTIMGSEEENPVSQRCSVFMYAYEAFTPESERKVKFFSPFPQQPAFDPAGALRLREVRGCYRGASKSHFYRWEISRSYQSHHESNLFYTHVLRGQHQGYISKVSRFSWVNRGSRESSPDWTKTHCRRSPSTPTSSRIFRNAAHETKRKQRISGTYLATSLYSCIDGGIWSNRPNPC